MMVERLQAYKAASRTLPKRVIIYRDGVGEVGFLKSSRLPKLLRENHRDNITTYSRMSFIRKCWSRSRRWRTSIGRRSPLSSAGSDITADSTRHQLNKNRTTVTPFLVQSKTEASRLRSCSTSTCRHILVSKERSDRPITLSSTTKTVLMPT